MERYKVSAIMVRFYDESVERQIEIPEAEAASASIEGICELAFKYGQNDFQPRPVCSVSVGDVIWIDDTEAPNHSWRTPKGRMRLRTRLFKVEPFGFEEITMAQLGNLGREAEAKPDNATMVLRYRKANEVAA